MDKRVKNSVESVVLTNGWFLTLYACYRVNRVFVESAALNTCYTNARLEFFRCFACVCYHQDITRVNVHLVDQIVRFSDDCCCLSTTGSSYYQYIFAKRHNCLALLVIKRISKESVKILFVF